MKWIFGKIKKSIPALSVMTISSLINTGLAVLYALQTQRVIDAAVAHDRETLIRECVWLALNVLAALAAWLLSEHLNERLKADVNCSVKKGIMQTLLHGEYQKVKAYHSGDLVYRLVGDADTFCTGVVEILPRMITLLFQLGATALAIQAMAPKLTFVLLLIAVALVGLTFLVKQRMKDVHKNVSAATGSVSGFLQECIENLLVIKGLNVIPEIENRADAELNGYHGAQMKRKNMNLVFFGGLSLMYSAVSLGALVWCAVLLMRGQITFGILAAVIQLADQLSGPIVTLPRLLKQFVAMFAVADRLREIDAIGPEEEPDPTLRHFEGIRAENVTFSYDRAPVLQNADFRILPGELTVIVGASGIGKSTLLKLLLGIYPPDSGTITICADAREETASGRTRGLFAYAPQGNLLLSGTLRSNLLLAKADATEEEIASALYVSCMDEYMPLLPDGLNTVIGENGTGLSEGQGQRLSLARAVISGAPVLLLDEITSALDAETERRVLTRMRALQGRSCIVVTHRPAVLELADRRIRVSAEGVECECAKENIS